jgi:sialic acid synthase SpsE
MQTKDIFRNKTHLNSRLPLRPFIIAEAGVNHENSIDLAKKLIDAAKEGGADAIKFQSYKAQTLASKHSPAYWDIAMEKTDSQYKLFKKHDKFWKKEFELLKIHCDNTGIEFLSTPFDIESASFLNDLMNTFKISSSDITNMPFIKYICAFDKPIILSTGASYMYEIEQAVHWINENGNQLALLHCILNYPTTDSNANIGMMVELKKKYPDKIIGYSDHTLPGQMKVCETAVLLGAAIIEKHFTLDKKLKGNDHYHAMDKEDLKIFILSIQHSIDIIGDYHKYPLESERIARENARRSLVAARNIPKNKTIEKEDLTFKRPGNGISPANIISVIGTTANQNIDEDEILKWTLLK